MCNSYSSSMLTHIFFAITVSSPEDQSVKRRLSHHQGVWHPSGSCQRRSFLSDAFRGASGRKRYIDIKDFCVDLIVTTFKFLQAASERNEGADEEIERVAGSGGVGGESSAAPLAAPEEEMKWEVEGSSDEDAATEVPAEDAGDGLEGSRPVLVKICASPSKLSQNLLFQPFPYTKKTS